MKLNTVICGKAEDVLKTFSDECIDLTVTSPPYDNLRDYKGYTFDFKKIANELYRVTKQGGVVVWVVGDATIDGSETGTSFKQALYFKEIGFNLFDTMIWQKPGFSAVGALSVRYAPVFEYMFILSKGKVKSFNPIKDRLNKVSGTITGTIMLPDGSRKRMSNEGKKRRRYGQRFNVWNITQVNKNDIHPAQFPEQLAHDHIISWSNEGDTVLDPFMGSGTTGVACKNLNRDFIGIELNEEYYKIAEKRITQTTERLL